MPEPLTVVVDFERNKIVFAIDARRTATWSAVAAPRRRTSQARTTFDRSVDDAAARIDALPADVRWIDVTAAYQDLADRIFASFGPAFATHVDDQGQSTCALDDVNCHIVCSTVCLSSVRRAVDHLVMAEEGRVEIPARHRRWARVGLVLDEVNELWISPFQSMIHLPGTDWVIHKEGFGPTIIGAVPIDEATAPYVGNHSPSRIRHYARAEVAAWLAEHSPTLDNVGPLSRHPRFAPGGRARRTK